MGWEESRGCVSVSLNDIFENLSDPKISLREIYLGQRVFLWKYIMGETLAGQPRQTLLERYLSEMYLRRDIFSYRNAPLIKSWRSKNELNWLIFCIMDASLPLYSLQMFCLIAVWLAMKRARIETPRPYRLASRSAPKGNGILGVLRVAETHSHGNVVMSQWIKAENLAPEIGVIKHVDVSNMVRPVSVPYWWAQLQQAIPYW